MNTVFTKTPLGICKIVGNANGVTSISICEQELASNEIPSALQEAVEQLREYFDGERTTFSLKLSPLGTDFQKKVWLELANIPYGTTVSYLELAKKIGDIKAIRAVANANGKNPLWIVIPCHRVIGTDGSLTGYAGGLPRKRWLLEHENPPMQQSLF
ncbi:methylated-DNA--[protein]-cysteine S-methyltransferase [Flavobacterium algicola]|uniref:methylated-DNA--[protein]-cysteine S-methyltransferase n=1 Tax=Flavobacterium algicola TaxID=556529 RepID=UPI001EFC4473|nr:methylated-DNA--[protein]-cysteine S-methyltransferase [Flavobacterium algicola]MCG9792035.1 methylated-DNA--[protein]-cysteine S-methyltransferase [Flavobacterium algicola]